jgi:hypothetical protein
MTILERYNAVKNKTLRDKLIHNYDAEYADQYNRKQLGTKSARLALTYGFVWADSPERDIYWRKLSSAIEGNMTLDEAFEKTYPSEAIKECKNDVMERAGFTIPEMKAHKDDPRGKEYGFFVADTIDGWEGKRYLVTKWKDKKAVWSATFTEDNFLAWARDNT